MNEFKKKLILLTDGFPFKNSETFIRTEYPYLEKTFDQVFFLTIKTDEDIYLGFDSNKIIAISPKRTKSRILSLFKKMFWLEIIELLTKKNLNLYTFRTAWMYLSKAIIIETSINKFISENNLNNIVLYSYWFDEKALAISLMKSSYPKFCRTHGWDLYEERHRNSYLPYRKFIIDNISTLFTISENGKEYILKKLPGFENKINVSKLGTYEIKLSNKQKRKKVFHLLSISSVIKLKRIDKIVRVISKIENSEIFWTHIGDGKKFNEIKNLASRKLSNKPNLNFKMLGEMSNDEVITFLKSNYVDLFLNLSEYEGIPVSIMEAQSCGIPVLANYVGGVGEIVDNKNGFIVSKNEDENKIANIIENYLMINKKEKLLKRKNSFENWNNNFNSNLNYKNFSKLISKY